MLAKDGEGASKLLECVCSGAPTKDTAIIVAKEAVSYTHLDVYKRQCLYHSITYCVGGNSNIVTVNGAAAVCL